MSIALITGGNKGIGKATARRLVELGHTVYIGARDAERGKAAAKEVGAQWLALDVTSDASAAAAAADLTDEKAGSTSWSTTPRDRGPRDDRDPHRRGHA